MVRRHRFIGYGRHGIILNQEVLFYSYENIDIKNLLIKMSEFFGNLDILDEHTKNLKKKDNISNHDLDSLYLDFENNLIFIGTNIDQIKESSFFPQIYKEFIKLIYEIKTYMSKKDATDYINQSKTYRKTFHQIKNISYFLYINKK
jgi:hypothetical protein